MAEKARLAHENSIYARENRFLREIVEYHQLTMQDVVYLDEGSEEVTEVYPFTGMLSVSPPSPLSPPSPYGATSQGSPVAKEIFPVPSAQQETQESSEIEVPPSSGTPVLEEVEDENCVPANKEQSASATCNAIVKEQNEKTPSIHPQESGSPVDF